MNTQTWLLVITILILVSLFGCTTTKYIDESFEYDTVIYLGSNNNLFEIELSEFGKDLHQIDSTDVKSYHNPHCKKCGGKYGLLIKRIEHSGTVWYCSGCGKEIYELKRKE